MITWVCAVVVKPAAPAATETEVQKKTGDKEAVVGTPGRRTPGVGCAYTCAFDTCLYGHVKV